MNLRTIEIDWDIHKLIESERRGFDEPSYCALRRLLGLSDIANAPETDSHPIDAGTVALGIPWSEDGVRIPHGSLARMKYNYGRQTYEGKFWNGELVVGDQAFDSLSNAANALAVTKRGTSTQLNGWKYWEVKFPGESDWKKLWDLREQFNREFLSKLKINI